MSVISTNTSVYCIAGTEYQVLGIAHHYQICMLLSDKSLFHNFQMALQIFKGLVVAVLKLNE